MESRCRSLSDARLVAASICLLSRSALWAYQSHTATDAAPNAAAAMNPGIIIQFQNAPGAPTTAVMPVTYRGGAEHLGAALARCVAPAPRRLSRGHLALAAGSPKEQPPGPARLAALIQSKKCQQSQAIVEVRPGLHRHIPCPHDPKTAGRTVSFSCPSQQKTRWLPVPRFCSRTSGT